jgi:uncharacterized protein
MPTLKTLTPAPNASSASEAAQGPDAAPLAQAQAQAQATSSQRKAGPANPQKYAVQVGPSAIEGLGAFAAQPIPAGRKIGEIRGERVSTKEAFARARAAQQCSGHVFMVAISERASIDASASTDPLRHANHSCAPNMVLKVQQGRVAFYAIHDIAAGEELTARYGPTHHAGRLACRCGAPQCVGWL